MTGRLPKRLRKRSRSLTDIYSPDLSGFYILCYHRLMEETNKNFDLSKFIMPGAIGAAIISSNGGLGRPAADIGFGVKPQGQVDVSVDDDAFLGDEDAPVVVIEFSDFQCPFCRSFWRDTLPEIKSQYIDTGKVKFVYRDFPLDFHPGAMPAAQATECAEDQGKFWEMHDKIFIEQDKQGGGTIQFGIDDLEKWASEMGLNTGDFNSCLDSQKYAEEVKKDSNDCRLAGVSGTPSFSINGRLIVGAQPFSAFKSIIDEELNK